MKSRSELSLLQDTIPYRNFDKKIFVGMRCNVSGSGASIIEIQPSPDGTMFQVLFDQNSSLAPRDTESSMIEWPDHLDISDPEICNVLMAPTTVPPNSKKTGMQIFTESAQIEAMVDTYYGRFEGPPPRSGAPLEEFDEYDYEDSSRRQAEERSDYNDSASRAHEEGWFHSDSDN